MSHLNELFPESWLRYSLMNALADTTALDNIVIGLSTAVGTIIIMLGTIAVWRSTQRSQRQAELEAQINAEINKHYREITDLSDRAQQLHNDARELQGKVGSEHERLAADRDALEALHKELNDLRDKWGSLVPTMEAIEDSPELLHVTAQQQLDQGSGIGRSGASHGGDESRNSVSAALVATS